MPCQCGCSTAEPRADVPADVACECGCSTPDAAAETLDVAALARLVQQLDRRVRELESSAART